MSCQPRRHTAAELEQKRTSNSTLYDLNFEFLSDRGKNMCLPMLEMPPIRAQKFDFDGSANRYSKRAILLAHKTL